MLTIGIWQTLLFRGTHNKVQSAYPQPGRSVLKYPRAEVHNPRSVGHLVPGRTERINDLHYFRFIYYLSLNDVLFWKMTRFSLLHPSMSHSWRISRRLSRSRDTLHLKAGPWKYCLTLNRSVAQRGLGTTALEEVQFQVLRLQQS